MGKLQQITSSATAAEGSETTFSVCDESEHWTPGRGGPDLAQTIQQNLAKTGGRMLETCNAWVPGVGSVAETTFDAWVAQQEGRTRGKQRILYDARVAPPGTDLRDECSLREALRFVYAELPWVNLDPIVEEIWSPTYPESRSRRFFLNQPNAEEDAWVTLQEWSVLADTSREVVPGDEVALFFDGSKSGDATALVGCRISDGHVFKVGLWQPRPGENVSTESVDSAVRGAYDRYTVVGFFADVREWESFTKDSWPEVFRDGLRIMAVPGGKQPQWVAWDMRTHVREFAEAAEQCLAEIRDGGFTHDGDWDISRHVGNARRREYRGLVSVRKESPDSAKKIDGCVCVIGARMVRRLYLASESNTPRGAWGFGGW